MIADRLLARLREVVGYVPTTWSLVRVACVVVLTLVLAGLVIPSRPGVVASPYNKNAGTERTRVVSLPLGDTRGFRPAPAGDDFRIAWIGGSEVLGVNPRERSVIPGLVNNRIAEVAGRPTRTDMYYLNAMRLVDELASLHSALASEPDLVVVSLNPVWAFNDIALQQWGYLDGIIARGSLWPPSAWPEAASFVGPGDVGWRALSRVSAPVEERLPWGTDLTEKTSGLSFLDEVSGGQEPPPTGLGRLAQRRAIDFWVEHGRGVPQDAPLIERQLALLDIGVSPSTSLNHQVLEQMFAAVRRAGVDAYFYVPAIAPQVYAEPEGKRSVERLRKLFADAARGQTTSRVHFDPQGLQDRVPPTPYKDMIHKIDPGPEVSVLTGDLCALLEQRGHETGCEAP